MNQKSSKWRTIRFIAESNEKRPFSIVSNVYGQPTQIMDSKTFEIIELDDQVELESESGETIYLLEFNNRWYLVPEMAE